MNRWVALLSFVLGCGAAPQPAPTVAGVVEKASLRSIILIGTNDLHGHLGALPALGGYLRILRAQVAAQHAAVVLVDAGDMFQGTLESNVVEGESIAKAYAALGYAAVAVGNHEFDFGPLGPRVSVPPGQEGSRPDADPRGALRALARSAGFPFLLANVARNDAHAGQFAMDLSPLAARVVLDVQGVKIGFTGVTSSDTSATTLAANVRDLTFTPPVGAVQRQADELRRQGATVVVALAHAGSKCDGFTGNTKADHCELHGEVFGLADGLRKGSVDAIVAGHTHFGVAHDVNGMPVIESFSYGRAFGRVDLALDERGRVVSHVVHAPRFLCPTTKIPADEKCDLGEYEGERVVRDESVARIAEAYVAQTQQRREALVGVTFQAPFTRSYGAESALGNLFARLLRVHAHVDVALMNGGGMRDDLPAGPLRYGQLFAAMPFDNRVALVTVRVAELRTLFAQNLQSAHGVLSVDGLVVEARCHGSELAVDLYRADHAGARVGKKLDEAIALRLAASDFLLGGGDDFGTLGAFAGRVTVTDDVMRDVFERQLHDAGTLDPALLYDPSKPRLDHPGARPLRCGDD